MQLAAIDPRPAACGGSSTAELCPRSTKRRRKFYFVLPSQPESANLTIKVVVIMLYEISHAGFSVVITWPISALAKSAV